MYLSYKLKIIDFGWDSYEDWFNLSCIHAERGRFKEALECVEQAIGFSLSNTLTIRQMQGRFNE